MPYDPSSAEVFAPQNPPFEGPELELFEGGGETFTSLDSELRQAALHAVPELKDGPATGVQEEVLGTGETDRGSAVLRLQAATEAGRLLTGRTDNADFVVRFNKPETAVSGIEEQRWRSGGSGGWLLREHEARRKAEAKERAKAEAQSHEDGCNCEVCAA